MTVLLSIMTAQAFPKAKQEFRCDNEAYFEVRSDLLIEVEELVVKVSFPETNLTNH